MNYTYDSSTPASNNHDCIIVPILSKDKKALLHDAGKQLDKATDGSISKFIKTGDFSGKMEQTQILYNVEGIQTPRVLLAGCGEQDKFDLAALNKVTKAASKVIKDADIKSACFYIADLFTGKKMGQAAIQIIIAHADSFYQLNDYKSEVKPQSKLSRVSVGFTNKPNTDIESAIKQGAAIAEGMNLAKNLANRPGNVCTPSYIANQAQLVADAFSSISIEILEESDMQELGMGAFLSVSKGSDEPGKMVVLQYQGAKKESQAPVALVGKGITFDSGGISLKPGANMDEMKFDMGGAAGMLGTLKACAEMKLRINLVVVLATAENMPSGRASKPGDIVTSMSGKTIEVLNTDAEGRLVLCDALTYVAKFKPEIIIDAATLTGACIIALGHYICAVLSNNNKLARKLMDAGSRINDRAWQLPIGDDYTKLLKSSFADLGNIGGRAAGTITAACFLSEFTKDFKWAHLDIAGTAWDDKDATGRPVPLLTQFLIDHANKKH